MCTDCEADVLTTTPSHHFPLVFDFADNYDFSSYEKIALVAAQL